MPNIQILFGYFTEILLLRRGPQDLPTSRSLLATLILLNIVAGTLLYSGQEGGSSNSLQSIVDIGLSLVMYSAVLNLRGFRERVVQTLTAFTGTGLLLTLILFPISLLLGQEGENFYVTAGRLMFMGLLIWSLAVDGHIFRHALGTSMMVGTVVAVGIFIARIYILEAVWPN
jgi:hypothetical protein